MIHADCEANSWWRRPTLLILSVALSLGAALSTVFAQRAEASHLPDLNPSAPYNVGFETVNGQERLGFASKFVNEGSYKLLLRGRGPAGGPLRVQQYISGAYRDANGDALDGEFFYQSVGVGQTGHNHWHMRDLMSHELRELSKYGGDLVAKGSKQGFCLAHLSTNSCNRGEPNRSEVKMGLGVGGTDTYSAQVEGQYVVVNGVPAGDYVVRFQVDPNRTVAESSRSDNFSSARIRLTRDSSGKLTGVSRLASCSSSATCDP